MAETDTGLKLAFKNINKSLDAPVYSRKTFLELTGGIVVFGVVLGFGTYSYGRKTGYDEGDRSGYERGETVMKDKVNKEYAAEDALVLGMALGWEESYDEKNRRIFPRSQSYAPIELTFEKKPGVKVNPKKVVNFGTPISTPAPTTTTEPSKDGILLFKRPSPEPDALSDVTLESNKKVFVAPVFGELYEATGFSGETSIIFKKDIKQFNKGTLSSTDKDNQDNKNQDSQSDSTVKNQDGRYATRYESGFWGIITNKNAKPINPATGDPDGKEYYIPIAPFIIPNKTDN